MRGLETCPHCGSEYVSYLSGSDTILCLDCKKESPWPLKPGVKSIADNRVGEKPE